MVGAVAVVLAAWFLMLGYDALAQEGKWKVIIDTADAATGPPESIRALVRARAELAVGGPEKAESSIRLGLQAAAREGRLPAALGMADKLSGGTVLANEELAALCADAGLADLAFRLLRARLASTAGSAALLPAYQAAKVASPNAPSVADFDRYLALFEETEIDPEVTAAAVAAEPSYVPTRMTHALVLLQRGKPAEADAVFDDITVYFDQLPPAYQAVVGAIASANGRASEATAMARKIDASLLTPGEKQLLRGVQPAAVP